MFDVVKPLSSSNALIPTDKISPQRSAASVLPAPLIYPPLIILPVGPAVEILISTRLQSTPFSSTPQWACKNGTGHKHETIYWEKT